MNSSDTMETYRDSGIDMSIDVVELSLEDFDRILGKGADSEGFYHILSSTPVKR